jgi:hypothetical protein
MTRPGFLALDAIRHRAAIVGRVSDGAAPIAGVEVVITAGPAAWTARLTAIRQGKPAARPDRVVTDGAGFFVWLDLPAGSYTLRAQLADPRYAATTATVAVLATAPGTADLVLAPTQLAGSVVAETPPVPLAMARIRIVDSGELAYTAADGSFLLSPIEPGTDRVIEVSAQRYTTLTSKVTVTTGHKTTTAPLVLTRS